MYASGCIIFGERNLGSVTVSVSVTVSHGILYKVEITFSDMLRAVRMVIWRDTLISRKGKITSSVENITPEMERWIGNMVKCMLQAA